MCVGVGGWVVWCRPLARMLARTDARTRVCACADMPSAMPMCADMPSAMPTCINALASRCVGVRMGVWGVWGVWVWVCGCGWVWVCAWVWVCVWV